MQRKYFIRIIKVQMQELASKKTIYLLKNFINIRNFLRNNNEIDTFQGIKVQRPFPITSQRFCFHIISCIILLRQIFYQFSYTYLPEISVK